MALNVEVLGLDEIRADLKQYPKAAKSAARRAISRTLTRLRTQISKEVRKDVKIPARDIKRQIRITKQILQGTILIGGRPRLLSRYGAKQVTRAAPGAAGDPSRGIPAGRKQAGVRVQVKPRGGSKVLPGAFLIPLKRGSTLSSDMGVAIRLGPGRNDYEVLHGPSVAQVVEQLEDKLRNEGQSYLLAQYERELEFAINRIRGAL